MVHSLSKPPEEFTAQLEAIEVALDASDTERFAALLEMVLKANKRFNLTAITDPQTAWMRHIFDSLTLVATIESADAKAVADIGAGGGFPGLVLAIALPEVAFTLVESTGKKATFLRDASQKLCLGNVDVLSDRAETIGHDRERHREQYDVVLARAVGKLNVLIELTAALAKVGGHIAAIKGEKAQDEIAQARQALYRLHCRVIDTQRTPTGTIVVIEKRRRTPKDYPRRPGEPKRNPINF